MVTEELFALVDFQSFQSQPQRACLHAKFWLWIRKAKDRTFPPDSLSGCIYVYIIYIYSCYYLFPSRWARIFFRWWSGEFHNQKWFGQMLLQSHTNLTPNHRKIPIISGKSGLVKSYPPTLRKVMQDAIQREDLAAGPGVELEKMGNWLQDGRVGWILVGEGSLVFHFCLKPIGFHRVETNSKSIIWIRKAAFCFGGKLAVQTDDMYVYTVNINIALEKVNQKLWASILMLMIGVFDSQNIKYTGGEFGWISCQPYPFDA